MDKSIIQTVLNIKAIDKLLICLTLCLFHVNSFADDKHSKQIFDGISKQFSSSSPAKGQQSGELFLLLITAAVLVFVVWLAYQFFGQKEKHTTADNAWDVYKKLCRAHNLNVTEKHVVRKVYRQIGLDDPLPLFVEPEYFRQTLNDESMSSCHSIVRDIMKKLFEQNTVSPQIVVPEEYSDNVIETPIETLVNPAALEIEAAHRTAHLAHVLDDTASRHHFENAPIEQKNIQEPIGGASRYIIEENLPTEETVVNIQNNQNASNVLLSTIPGQSALTSLLEPFNQMTTEIAAVSIRHTLSEGGELNQRTFDAVGARQNGHPEPLTPAFPKSNVPTPQEMLGSEQRADSASHASPTPQFLQRRIRVSSPTTFSQMRRGDIRFDQERSPIPSNNGNTQEAVALLETIVTKK